MRELWRRLIVAAALVAATVMFLWTPPVLLRVRPVDWEAERERKLSRAQDAKRLMGPMVGQETIKGVDLAPEARLAPEAFIDHETRGRLVPVRGLEWEGFFSETAVAVKGRPASASWKARAGRGLFSNMLYFRPDEAPLSGLAREWKETSAVRYVRIDGDGRSEYLLIIRVGRQEVFRYGPVSVAFPYRHGALWLALAGFLAYLFIPWTRRPARGVYYSRLRAGVLPDVLAAVMGGVFFFIPLVVPTDFSGDSPFAPGWNMLTAVCWLLAMISFGCFGIAAFYMARKLDVVDEGFVYTGLGRSGTGRFDEIGRVDAYEIGTPKWITRALWILSLFSWRALGPALLLGGAEPGILLRMKDGRSYRFILKALIGGEALVGTLRAAGVPISPEVYEAFGRAADDRIFTKDFPPIRKRRVAPVLTGLACLVPLLYGLYRTVPVPTPVGRPAPFDKDPFQEARPEKPKVSWEGLAREEELLKQMREENRSLGEIVERMKKASPEKRKALLKDYGESMGRFEDLQKRFDRIHEGRSETDQ
jgi:hypothetical protein